MIRGVDRRGQGLSVNAIILIILAVVVLVVLIAGFTIGYNRILPFLSSNNVDTIVSQCQAACATDDEYGFNILVRELNDGEAKIETSCFVFAELNAYEKYGIDSCEGMEKPKCADMKIDGNDLTSAQMDDVGCVKPVAPAEGSGSTGGTAPTQ